MKNILWLTILLVGTYPLFSQDYLEAFQEGEQLFQKEQYYEAYLRFNAAMVLSKNVGQSHFAQQSQERLDAAAYGIQRQQVVTDSLLQAMNKLIDAFYFYDDRLALAYNGVRYGYINKNGETEIDYEYSSATNFDQTTGYAMVEMSGRSYWLSPDGKKYPGDQEVNSLPKVVKEQGTLNDEREEVLKNLDAFQTNGKKEYHKVLKDGIRQYNNRKYYDAYLRFNAATVLAENADDNQMAQLGKQLKDTAIYEIRNLFTQAEEALQVAENIRNALYFYEDRYGLAYKDKEYYFIDKDGQEHENLGKWEKAEPFGDKGLAKVEKAGGPFLVDTTGQYYKVAYSLKYLKNNITALDLRGIPLDSFPIQILNYPQLKILILDGDYSNPNSIIKLPAGIQSLENLEVLSLKYCKIKSLLPGIGQLKQLISLDLGSNELSALLPEIGQLQQLTRLDLSSNVLSALPPEIGQLHQLSELSLIGNQLSALPPEIGQLQQLTELNLKSNALSDLPSEIGQLQQLTRLDLSYNPLSELPSEIGQLQQLSRLNLMYSGLIDLPSEIGQLQQLSSLNLSYNPLSELPSEIVRLQRLSRLYLRSSRLSELPSEIGQLKTLTSLDLSYNRLSELPSEIGQLQQLNRLNLRSNRLSELPSEIGQLQQLSSLNLRSNGLSELPSEIGQLQQLTELDLRSNRLSELPSEIGQLQQLTKLYLSVNELSEIPPETGQLQQLNDLYLDVNHISEEQQNQIKKLLPNCRIRF